MPVHTRRHFLQAAAALGGALACGEAARGEAPPVQMAIARWGGALDANPDLKSVASRLTERAISDLGGMARFVKRGGVVWIKPNIGFPFGPEFAVNTNPDVVATLARLCLEAGAKEVKAGDSSLLSAALSYKASGIEDAIVAAGGTSVMTEKTRFKNFPIHGERLSTWPLYPDILEADLIIDVPIVKQHPLTRVSACMKNLMGVAGGSRDQWHSDLVTCLTDISAFVRPKLCVVDAVRILTAGGPTGGELSNVKIAGIVAAGTDIVALDAFSATLLGMNPSESRTMAMAEKRGLGSRDYTKLVLREGTVS
jgi:uncharacterized protein (DUF362 family)